MKRFRKFMALGAAIAALAIIAIPALADEPQGLDAPPPTYSVPPQTSDEERQAPNFLSRTGVVQEIAPFYGPDGEALYGESLIRITGPDIGTIIFHKDYNTFVLGSTPQVGDTITGYFEANMPMILIYPPQHRAQFILTGEMESFEFEFVKIDRFDAQPSEAGQYRMVSQDGSLHLNFSDYTPVYLQDGQEFELLRDYSMVQELDGRILVVTYSLMDRSYPGGTIPADPALRINVLWERAVALPIMPDLEIDLPQVEEPDLPLEGDPIIEFSVNEGIIVSGERIEGDWRQVNGAFYVPFRAVVNSLGFGDTIVWDGDNMMITVNNGTDYITFPIGANTFIVGDEVVSLDDYVLLEGGTTYVPIQFFRLVFGMNNAYMLEGQAVIDNDELMQ